MTEIDKVEVREVVWRGSVRGEAKLGGEKSLFGFWLDSHQEIPPRDPQGNEKKKIITVVCGHPIVTSKDNAILQSGLLWATGPSTVI